MSTKPKTEFDHSGSSFDSFLKEEGILEEVEAIAIRRVIAWQSSQQSVIGLIGGMSWKSSAEYYRLINEGVRGRLGGAHSARVLMWSFDFGEIEALQHA